MNLYPRIYKIADGTLVGSWDDIVIPADSFGSVVKSLETNYAQYRYGDIQVAVENLPENFFADYKETANLIYLMEVQFGESRDHSSNKVVFYGVIDRTTIKWEAMKKRLAFSVLSMDKLLNMSPDIEPRGTFSTGTTWDIIASTGVYDSNTPYYTRFEPHIRLPNEGDAVSEYLKLGATVVFDKVSPQYNNKSLGSAEFRAVLYGDSGIIGPDKAIKNDLFYTRTQVSGYLDNIWAYGYATPEVPVEDTMFVLDQNMARKPNAYLGGLFIKWIDMGDGTFRAVPYRITSAETATRVVQEGGPPIGTYECLKITGTPIGGHTIPLYITGGTKNFSIYQNIDIPKGTPVTVFGDKLYGLQGGVTGPFNTQLAIQGLFQSVPFLNWLSPTITVYGTPPTISRLYNFSDRPDEALTQIQAATNTLIDIVPGTVGPNLIRSIQVNVYTREYLANRAPVNATIPLQWSENKQGFRPVVVVKGGPPVNRLSDSDSSYGWYTEDESGNPDYRMFTKVIPNSDKYITIEAELVAPSGVAFYDGSLSDFYYNDDGLREVAELYYRLYGKFYREVQATINDIADDWLGRVINEPFQKKKGIVMEQDVDYVHKQTVLKILLSDETPT